MPGKCFDKSGAILGGCHGAILVTRVSQPTDMLYGSLNMFSAGPDGQKGII